MIESFLKFVLSNVYMLLFVAGLVVAGIQSLRGTRRKPDIVECFLSNLILFNIGISFFYNFIMHVFFGDMAAAYIGWAQSPFQAEVGFASLGMSVAGFIAYKDTYRVRLVAIISPALFLMGAACGHIYQMITTHNFAPGNAGFVFWWDIFLPVILLSLLKFSRDYENSHLKGN